MLIESSLGEYWDATLLNSGDTSEVLDMVVARHQAGLADLWLWLRTNVAEDFGESETFYFTFQQDDAEAFNSAMTTVFALCDHDLTAIVTADPESTPLKTAGKTIWESSLPGTVTKRYTRWVCVHATGTAVLTVDAMLLAGRPPANTSVSQVYTSNVTVPN